VFSIAAYFTDFAAVLLEFSSVGYPPLKPASTLAMLLPANGGHELSRVSIRSEINQSRPGQADSFGVKL